MGQDKKRQIKKEKIISALASAKYSIIQWFIDSANMVSAFQVRNDLNNLDIICTIPDNILMTVDNGLYLTKMSSPDFDQSINLWNELTLTDLKTYAIQVNNGLILKRDSTTWETYSTSTEKRAESDIDEIASNFIGLDESNVKIISSGASSVQIIGQQNPFDIILDGGDYIAENVNSRVEDCHPSILINYKGFTYGQAVPLINIKVFMDQLKKQEDIKDQAFEVKLAKWHEEIAKYQSVKIKTSGEEAIQLLTNFTESLKKTLKEWDTQWESSSEKLSRIQNVLEQANKTKVSSDIVKKAHTALKETIEQLLSKRDATIGLLSSCKEVFHQI